MVTGATKPKGSKRLLTVDSTPRRVNGLSLTATLNVNVSESMFQHKPRLLCMGRASSLRPKSFRPAARSPSVKACTTVMMFEAILCSLRFDSAREA